MLALLPAIATVTGAVVLRQIPGPIDLAAIFLVILGVALHRPAETQEPIAPPGEKRHAIG